MSKKQLPILCSKLLAISPLWPRGKAFWLQALEMQKEDVCDSFYLLKGRFMANFLSMK